MDSPQEFILSQPSLDTVPFFLCLIGLIAAIGIPFIIAQTMFETGLETVLRKIIVVAIAAASIAGSILITSAIADAIQEPIKNIMKRQTLHYPKSATITKLKSMATTSLPLYAACREQKKQTQSPRN